MSEPAQFRFRMVRTDEVEVMTDGGHVLALRLQSVSPTHATARSASASLDVRRARRFPAPELVITRGAAVVATVRAMNVWRMRYEIALADETWALPTPLFRARFTGTSSRAERLLVAVIRQNLWDVLLDRELASTELLASLACIQRMRWMST